jgi:hypothetical protein
MLTTVEGIFRDGKIELAETPADVVEDTPVIVTFLTNSFLAGHTVDLETRGIARRQALVLRERLASFAEDWNSPEMDMYDHYDEAKPTP